MGEKVIFLQSLTDRLGLWKTELQKFADATGLTIIPLAESLPA
jgi:hypothetical protein